MMSQRPIDHADGSPAPEESAGPPVIDAAWTRRQLETNLNRVLNPAVCHQAIDALGRSTSDFGAIAAALQGDPFVAAKVVALANLARRGGDATVTSIERAVAVLGVRAVRTLVIAVMLTGPLVAAPGHAVRRKDLWRWVFGCAAAGDRLATVLDGGAVGAVGAVGDDGVGGGGGRAGESPRHRGGQQHLVQGLLLGLGPLILRAGLGRQYDRTLGVALRPLGLAERERQTLGVTHHQVTLWALESMNCPAELGVFAQALLSDDDEPTTLHARAVEVLGARAAGLSIGWAEAWLADALPRLGVEDEDFVDQSLPAMRSRVRELTRAFDTDLGSADQRDETRQRILLLAGESLREMLEELADPSAHALRRTQPEPPTAEHDAA